MTYAVEGYDVNYYKNEKSVVDVYKRQPLHFRFKSDAKVRHFLKSANIYRIIFQTFYV